MTLAPLREAADSLAKASTPEPFSSSRTSNWVARAGGLPDYIQHIAHDLVEKRGMTVSRAIATAIAIVKNPPRNWGAQARAAAAKAAAEWEAKKAASHAKAAVQHSDLPFVVPTLADELAVRESAILRLAIFEQRVGHEGILELLDPAALMEAAVGFAPSLRRVASAPGEDERHEVLDGDQMVGAIAKQRSYDNTTRYRAMAVNGDRVGEIGIKSRADAIEQLRKHLEEAPARVMAHRDGKFLVARPKSYGGTMSYDEFPNEQSARHAAGLPPSASSPERASQVEQLGEMIAFDLATAAGVPPIDRLRRAAEARLGVPLAEAFNPGELRNFIGRWTKGGEHTLSLGPLKDLSKLPPASTRLPGRVTVAARSAESRARVRASAAARKAHAAKPQISVDDLEKGLPEGVWSAGAKSALDRLRDGSIKNTVQAHTDRQGNFSEERQQLHERILSDLLQGKATHEGKAIAVFTAGGPASGKSSVIDNGLVAVPHDPVQVSPDIIRKMLPEYQMLRAAGRQDLVGPATHDEAAMLTHQLMRLAMARQHHMVVDTVGDSEMGQFADKVHATDQAGYKVHVHYVTIPTAEAIRRSDARAAGAGKASDKGRVVDHAGLTELHRDVSRRFVDVARMKRVHVTVFSNEVKRGENPAMIAEKHPGSDKIHIKDRKKFLGFLRKGVETTSNAAERTSNAAERRRR